MFHYIWCVASARHVKRAHMHLFFLCPDDGMKKSRKTKNENLKVCSDIKRKMALADMRQTANG